MKNGNWIPISKGFKQDLPHNREYTKLEAAYSLQIDYDCKNTVTVEGYSNLWRWSRGRVYRFLECMNIKIKYPESTQKKRNQGGHIAVHKTDIKRTYSGHKRLIENNNLQTQADIKRTYSGHKTDIKRYTTIKPKIKKPKPKDKEKYTKEKHLEFVFLTMVELEKLRSKFGEKITSDWIERLNEYIGSKGKNYKSHYYTILTWARKDEKDGKSTGADASFDRYSEVSGKVFEN